MRSTFSASRFLYSKFSHTIIPRFAPQPRCFLNLSYYIIDTRDLSPAIPYEYMSYIEPATGSFYCLLWYKIMPLYQSGTAASCSFLLTLCSLHISDRVALYASSFLAVVVFFFFTTFFFFGANIFLRIRCVSSLMNCSS